MIERREYSGGFDYAELDQAAVNGIKSLAAKHGVSVLVYSTEIVINPFIGRDSGRQYVHFLHDIAPFIGNGEGEVHCESFDTDICGDVTFEFFSIHDGRLFCQHGQIVRGGIEPVIL